tara:strand:- start:13059 stop:13709 length:651 start_codon:yes stop_codon:yes gene_type:complete
MRATVLGANDGIVSMASLIVGVAAAGATESSIMIAAVAGLVAGAMSMAAGEYVSVSSQSDIEKADLEREKEELEDDFEGETKELADIYETRGLSRDLAEQVAKELMAHDAFGAHARDELNITEHTEANPTQAAFASAVSFIVGAGLPVVVAYLSSVTILIPLVSVTSILFLAILGGVSAHFGGANVWKAIYRVTFWGVAALAATWFIGYLFDVSIG